MSGNPLLSGNPLPYLTLKMPCALVSSWQSTNACKAFGSTLYDHVSTPTTPTVVPGLSCPRMYLGKTEDIPSIAPLPPSLRANLIPLWLRMYEPCNLQFNNIWCLGTPSLQATVHRWFPWWLSWRWLLGVLHPSGCVVNAGFFCWDRSGSVVV